MTRRGLADADVGHLRFLVVREHPDVGQRHDGDDLRADVDELAGTDLTLADETVGGRNDARVSEIVAAPGAPGPRRRRICASNCFLLNVESGQNGLLLRELRFVQLELRGDARL